MVAKFDSNMIWVLVTLVVLMGWMICRLLKLVFELASMLPTQGSTNAPVVYYDGPVPDWEVRHYWNERLYERGLISQAQYDAMQEELAAEVDITEIQAKK